MGIIKELLKKMNGIENTKEISIWFSQQNKAMINFTEARESNILYEIAKKIKSGQEPEDKILIDLMFEVVAKDNSLLWEAFKTPHFREIYNGQIKGHARINNIVRAAETVLTKMNIATEYVLNDGKDEKTIAQNKSMIDLYISRMVPKTNQFINLHVLNMDSEYKGKNILCGMIENIIKLEKIDMRNSYKRYLFEKLQLLLENPNLELTIKDDKGKSIIDYVNEMPEGETKEQLGKILSVTKPQIVSVEIELIDLIRQTVDRSGVADGDSEGNKLQLENNLKKINELLDKCEPKHREDALNEAFESASILCIAEVLKKVPIQVFRTYFNKLSRHTLGESYLAINEVSKIKNKEEQNSNYNKLFSNLIRNNCKDKVLVIIEGLKNKLGNEFVKNILKSGTVIQQFCDKGNINEEMVCFVAILNSLGLVERAKGFSQGLTAYVNEIMEKSELFENYLKNIERIGPFDTNKEGKTLGMIFVDKGNEAVDEYFGNVISKMTDEDFIKYLNIGDTNGDTFVHYITKMNNQNILEEISNRIKSINQELLKNNHPFMRQNLKGVIPLMESVNNTEVFNIIINNIYNNFPKQDQNIFSSRFNEWLKSTQDYMGRDIFHYVLNAANLDIANQIVDYFDLRKSFECNETYLMYLFQGIQNKLTIGAKANWQERIKIAKLILTKLKGKGQRVDEYINFRDDVFGNAAFHYFLLNTNIPDNLIDEGVKFFTGNSAELIRFNNEGTSPFMLILKKGRTQLLKGLLSYVEEIKDFTSPNFIARDGGNIFHMIATYGDIELLEGFLGKVETEAQDVIDKVYSLLGKLDYNRETSLHIAMRAGKDVMAMMLIEKGAPLNVADKYGDMPLDIAMRNRKKGIAMMLIKKGAPLNVADRDGDMPLHIAMKVGEEDIAMMLIEKGAPLNVADRYGYTPLHLAMRRREEDIAMMLIEKGAPLNVADRDGDMPLHIAIMEGKEDIARMLIEKGAPLNVANSYGDMPLHIAVRKGREYTARI